MRGSILIGASLALVAGQLEAKEPVVLPPLSKWVLDYADQKCRLMRTFGSTEAPALLSIEQSAPKASFTLTLAGPQLKGFPEAELTLGFSSVLEPQKETPFSGKVAKFGPALIISSVRLDSRDDEPANTYAEPQTALLQIDMADAKASDYVEVRRGTRHVRFDTGNLQEPMAALNTCTADLARSWGLDPDKLRTASRPPVWTNAKTVVRRISESYPASAIVAGERGIMELRVIVAADGSVTSCTIENATKTERLESPACREMRRAVFEPALDATKAPIPSLFATTIVYTIGD